MINPRRGEIEAVLGGRQFRLCLTLGALAELEHVFAAEDLSALARRLADGRLSARDALRIIAAGIRGGAAPTGCAPGTGRCDRFCISRCLG